MLLQPSLPGTGLILLGILVAIAAIFDIRYRRIPNWLVLAGIVVGFAWNVSHSGWSGLLRASEGLGLGFILYFPLYLLRAARRRRRQTSGGCRGDCGSGQLLLDFSADGDSGRSHRDVVLLFRGRVRKTFFNLGWMIQDLVHLRAPYRSNEELDVTSSKGMRLPHGALIAVGVLAFIFITKYGVDV